MNSNGEPRPQGHYRPARRHENLIFVSGMTPRRDGELHYVGQVNPAEPVESYCAPIELATENALQAARAQLATAEQVLSVLNLIVYINAPAGYTRHSQLADFASRLIESHLGSEGVPSRAAVGVSSLPGGAVVEVAMTAVVGKLSAGRGDGCGSGTVRP